VCAGELEGWPEERLMRRCVPSEQKQALPYSQAAVALAGEDAVSIRQPYSQNTEPRLSV